MKEKEIITVKQVSEYLQIDKHTVYKSQPIQRMGWTQPFFQKELWLARSGQIPSLKIAGQWRFKKDVIDKWISEQSLERVTQNMKSSPKKKNKGK